MAKICHILHMQKYSGIFSDSNCTKDLHVQHHQMNKHASVFQSVCVCLFVGAC